MRHAITLPSFSKPDRNERKKSPRRIFTLSLISCAPRQLSDNLHVLIRRKAVRTTIPGFSVTDPCQTSAVSYHETNLPNRPSDVICPPRSTAQKAWLLNFHLSRQSVPASSLPRRKRAGRRD